MKTFTKTFTKTIEELRLIIRHDQEAESPRTIDEGKLGYFITCDSRYDSPDQHDEIESIVKNTADFSDDVDEHMENITKEIKENGLGKVLYITPVYKYEHGNVMYKRGTAHGFDYSNCGFYIVTDKTFKEYTDGNEKIALKRFEKIIDAELAEYTQWANGEVYEFTLYDENGVEEEYGSNIYDIDDIKESLPKEWHDENMQDYLVM